MSENDRKNTIKYVFIENKYRMIDKKYVLYYNMQRGVDGYERKKVYVSKSL